jgi:hypothetical protein
MKLNIDWIGGNCPVQSEGTVDGKPYYFRARGEHWSMGIGGDPVGEPEWYWREKYSDDDFVAGWMTEEEAVHFINQAAADYAAGKRGMEF